jgi:hypothetical protein
MRRASNWVFPAVLLFCLAGNADADNLTVDCQGNCSQSGGRVGFTPQTFVIPAVGENEPSQPEGVLDLLFNMPLGGVFAFRDAVVFMEPANDPVCPGCVSDVTVFQNNPTTGNGEILWRDGGSPPPGAITETEGSSNGLVVGTGTESPLIISVQIGSDGSSRPWNPIQPGGPDLSDYIAISTFPEPSAVLLFGSGLAMLAALARAARHQLR